MPYHDSVLRLVGLAYEAAECRELWPAFLNDLADVVGSSGIVLLSHDTVVHAGSVVAAVNVDPSYQREYENYYAHVNVWMTKAGTHWQEGHVYPGQSICSDTEVERSEYYNDYLRKLDFFHAFGAMVRKDAEVLSMITGLRPRRQGPFDGELHDVFQLLMPHVQRALALHRRLARIDWHSRAAADLIDALPTAMVLVDGGGKPVLVNKAARRVLDRRDGLTLTDNLATSRSRDTSALRLLISRAANRTAGATPHPGGGLVIERPSGKRPLQVLVSPLSSQNAWATGSRQAVVAVMIFDPDDVPATNLDILAGLYGLTPTEAEVAAKVVAGERLEHVADALRMTSNTARWHLKHVLAKAGVHSQAQLVSQVLLGPAAALSAERSPKGPSLSRSR